MSEHTTNPRIIIDASYIRQKSSGAAYRAMCEQGGRIVLTDTLLWELYSTKDTNQWRASMNKLKAGVNAIEVWEHVSPIYKVELEENRPYDNPLHSARTIHWRKVIANDLLRHPDKALIDNERRKRESNKIVKLFQDLAHNFSLPKELRKEIRGQAGHKEKVVQKCYFAINDPYNIRSIVDAIKKIMKKDGLDVLLNPEDVDDTWAIWHFSKSLLVVLCDSLRQGEDTFQKIPEKFKNRLINTKHDLDYLTMLAFADALASCETMYWFKVNENFRRLN